MRVLLALLWLCAPARAAEPAPASVRLVYAQGWDSGLSIDLALGVEFLLKKEPGKVRLERVELAKSYFSNGAFLLDAPPDAAAKDLPDPSGPVKELEEVSILETSRSILLHHPRTYYPVLEKVAEVMRESSESRYWVGDIEFSSGTIVEGPSRLGEPLRMLRLKGRATGQPWLVTGVVRYHLTIDGRPTVVTAIGKPLGGPSRFITALRRELARPGPPALPLQLGSVGLPRDWKFPTGRLIGRFRELGFKVFAFQPDDADQAMPELLEAARDPSDPITLLATNVYAAPGSTAAWKAYSVQEVGGVRIGLVSIWPTTEGAHRLAARAGMTIRDPADSARDAIGALRREGVDLVVAIAHLAPEENVRFIRQLRSRVDILIGERVHERSVRKRQVVELSDWGGEQTSRPALETRWPMATIGLMTLDFERRRGRPSLSRAEETYAKADWDGPVDDKLPDDWGQLFDAFFGPKRLVLPDPRRLWPGSGVKLVYEPVEAWNVAAHALRRATKAEAALLRVRPLSGSGVGEVTETWVWEWFQPPEDVLIARLPGRALRQALAKLDLQPIPVPGLETGAPPRRYSTEVWLAAAGLQADGTVNGLPIRDEEWYSVATTEAALRDAGLADEPRASFRASLWPKNLGDTVMGWLLERRDAMAADERRLFREGLGDKLEPWVEKGAVGESLDKAFAEERQAAKAGADEAYRENIRLAAEGRRKAGPIWRLNLRELSVQFANTQVENRNSFATVPDARIQGISQVLAQGSASLFSELYWGRWRWDAGATAHYGRVTLKPRGIKPIENETADQWILETELRRGLLRTRLGTLGLFVNLAHDTEFTPPEGLPMRKQLRWSPGVKLFEGRVIRKAYVSAVVEEESMPIRNTEYGFEAGLKAAAPLPQGNGAAQLNAVYRQFARSPSDTPDDLKSQLDVEFRVAVPILGDLRLSPFIQYYRFEAKVVRETGYNLMFGVALDFSYLWKPVF